MDVSSIINRQFNLHYARTLQLQQTEETSVSSAVKHKTTTKDWVLRAFYPGAKVGKSSASVHPITNDTATAALDVKVAEKAPPSPKDGYTQSREPSVSFRQVVIDSAAEKFKFSLVGKFYRSRPSLEQIRKWVLARLRFLGEWSVTLLDRNHVLIKLDNEDDMLKIWPKSRWFVKGYPMKVFKWTPDFRPCDGEPSIAPVWISFPSLPVVYFEQDLLYAIASLLGRVLSMDAPTRRLSRTNVARVCVEIDLLKDHPQRVWIGVEKGGFWQAVKYEKLPSYCTHCRQQGHSLEICKAKRSNSISQKEPLNFVEKAKSVTQQLSAAFQRPNPAIKEEKPEHSYLEKHYQTCPSLLEKHSSGNLRIGSFTGKLQIKSGKGNEDCEEPNCSYAVRDIKCFSESGSTKIIDNVLAASSFSNENVSRTKTKLWKTVELLDDGKNLMQEEIEEVEEEDECDDDREKPGADDQEVKDVEELVANDEEIGEIQEPVNLNTAGDYHQEQRQIIRNYPKLPSKQFHQENGKKKTLFFWKTRAKQPKDAEMVPNIRVKNFTLRELQFATDGFSNKNVLGRGGFGKVYKGRLFNGSLVVIKRMKEPQFNTAGESEFKMEVEFSGIAVHKNILPLMGFCSVSERLLVYPYMANGALASQLRERLDNMPPLDWSTRKKIALGSAQGFSYLHEQINPKIIHRDVKAANILLNDTFEPLIGDFGLAKVINFEDYDVTTAVRGTIGHIAPEYLLRGKASPKSDVFGYGITLLELVTGQRAFDLARLANDDDVMLLDWVKGLVQENHLEIIVDPDLTGNYNVSEIRMFVNIALLCTRETPEERPKMSEVVSMLEGKTLAGIELLTSFSNHNLESSHIQEQNLNVDDDDGEISLTRASISSEIDLPR